MATPYKRPNRAMWYVEWQRDGRRIRVPAGKTKDEARNESRAIEALEATGKYSLHEAIATVLGAKAVPVERLTFKEAFPRYLDEAKATLAPSTLAKRTNTLKRIAKAAPWANLSLKDVRPSHINVWAVDLYGRGLGPCAVNRTIAAASVVFTWAARMGIVERNVLLGKTVQKRTEPKRDHWLTVEQQAQALEATPAHGKAIVEFLMETGARRGEAAALTVADLDQELRRAHLKHATETTKTSRTIDLSDRAWAIIKDQRVMAGPVFRSARGGPFSDPVFQTLIRSMRKNAPHLFPVGTGLHILRHSFITLAVAAGEPIALIGQYVGQSSAWITDRYAHHVSGAHRGMVDRLSAARGG